MQRQFYSCLAAIVLCSCATQHHAQRNAPACVATYNVKTSGAIADGKTKDTAAFQKAIDQAAVAGGEVLVPAGEYSIGSVELKSNVTLRLEKDANITGTPDLDDYPIVRARWEGRWVDAHRALISARDANNIAIVGLGTINGNPSLGGRQMPRRPCVIEPINCTNIRLEDFSTTQVRMWSIHPTLCEKISAKRLHIRSNTGNGDGIDVDSCKHVIIDSCDIDTGDDCIALKSGRGMEGFKQAKPTEDVLIANCTLGDNNFACIGIGSETSGGIRDVCIEHCIFTHAKTFAIYIKSRPGRGAFIENISANDLQVHKDVHGFLRINLLNSGIQDPQPVPGDEGIPTAKNYSFSDVKVAGVGPLVEAFLISPSKPLDGLTLSNISGDCQTGISLSNITRAKLSEINITGFTGPKLATLNVTGDGLENAAVFTPPPPQAQRSRRPASTPASAP